MKYFICLFLMIGFTLSVNAQDTKMEKKPFLGLRTVIYKVDDINKATEWYTKVVKKAPYFDEPFYVGFNVGGYELGLEPVEAGSIEVGTNEISYWGVQDVNKEYQRLLELGAKPHEEPQNVGGEIVTASVIDPWGNVIGIIYNPEFKAE